MLDNIQVEGQAFSHCIDLQSDCRKGAEATHPGGTRRSSALYRVLQRIQAHQVAGAAGSGLSAAVRVEGCLLLPR